MMSSHLCDISHSGQGLHETIMHTCCGHVIVVSTQLANAEPVVTSKFASSCHLYYQLNHIQPLGHVMLRDKQIIAQALCQHNNC